MTVIEFPTATRVNGGKKPRRNFSDHQKLQRRLASYAAMGPNCANGHPWDQDAKFTYNGFRFCGACTREKAEQRRNDPATYTGTCPHGHEYTRENTMITSLNNKVCRTCKQQPDARPRTLKPGEMDEILRRARRGDTQSEISGEGSFKNLGKGIISRVRLLGALLADTPEAKELKSLLKQNAQAATCNGRPPLWSYESMTLLETEYKNGSDSQKIADLINTRFGREFSIRSIYSKAHKLGLVKLRSRVVVPKSAKLPPLMAVLRFPIGSLLDRINTAVPRHLPRDHRDDVIGEMALAVYEGRLEEGDIERRIREFVNAGYRREHDPYGPLSLDAPIFADSSLTLGDRITTGLWQ